MLRTLRIDVWFDLVCPWCLIGKRQLARALARLAEDDPSLQVDTQWHGVQLIPQVPPEGWPFGEFYLRRLGSPQAVRRRQAQVTAAAAEAGVTIDLARIARFPNTARAHRLLAYSARQPLGVDAMLERLFAAYFQRGEDIGDMATLLRIAEELGLDTAAARASIDAEQPLPAELPAEGGVPLFVFNQQLALSGAQPPEILLSAIRQSAERRAAVC